MANLADYEWLIEDGAAGLLAEAQSAAAAPHQVLSRLRRSLSPERAALVVQQADLRQRGAAKFGKLADKMFFTDVGLQQSTDLWVARYKASRIDDTCSIADYCTGIGGDLVGLADVGPTRGCDATPELALMASANARVAETSFPADVTNDHAENRPPTSEEIWHLDPDRRTNDRRSTQLQWHSPDPAIVDRWLLSSHNGILKLAPATRVPTVWATQAEREWISRDRQCRQQVVWFGQLATSPGCHRASTVMVNKDGTVESASFTGLPDGEAPSSAEVGRYIYDTDAAIRAARLTGALAAACGLRALQSGPSYLTGDHAIEHPLLARFEVNDVLPLRTKPLAKHLRSLDIGTLEIKKRGVETDPERLRKELKLQGDRAATLLLLRIESRELAVLATRGEG
ncbi:MAG: hypothetical protein AAGD11_19560 [Planctomycetota bacterium]